MFRPVRSAALLSLLLGAGACADFLGTGDSTPSVSQALTAAFTTVPAEFSNNTSSFGGDSDGVPSLWLPGPGGRAFGREGLMGGGLGDAFAGSMSAGRGFGHHGPFGGRFGGGRTCDGTFSASTGWFVCTPITKNGVTVGCGIRVVGLPETPASSFMMIDVSLNIYDSGMGLAKVTASEAPSGLRSIIDLRPLQIHNAGFGLLPVSWTPA